MWGKGLEAQTCAGLNRHSLEEAARRLEREDWTAGMTRLELVDVIERVVTTYNQADATIPHN